MNFVDANEDEQILQYYTIVNGNTSSLIPVHHPFLLQNNEEEAEMETITSRPLLFVSLAHDDQTEEDSVDRIQQEEDGDNQSNEVADINTTPSFFSNLKLVTLEDGRMFVTADDSSK